MVRRGEEGGGGGGGGRKGGGKGGVERGHGNGWAAIIYWAMIHGCLPPPPIYRSGLHPNGIPCHKKKNVKFESITRDVSHLS